MRPLTLEKQNVPSVGARLFAFLTDCLIVAAILCAPFLLSIRLDKLGSLNWVPAFAIAVLYFSVFDSGKLLEATPGKKLLSVKVVRTDGQNLSLFKAFLRAALVLFLLNNGNFGSLLPFNLILSNTFALGVTAIFVGATFFTVLHPQKRALHDVITGSIVMKRGEMPSDILNFTTKTVGSIVAAVALCSLALLWVNRTFENFEMKELMDLRSLIQSEIQIEQVSVSTKRTTVNGNVTGNFVGVTLFVPNEVYENGEAREILRNQVFTILAENLDRQVDAVHVALMTIKSFGLIPITVSESKSEAFKRTL